MYPNTNISPFLFPSAPGNYHPIFRFYGNIFPEQILTIWDRKKRCGIILRPVPEKTWEGEGFSWAGDWAEWAISKIEVGRIGQTRESQTFLASREFPTVGEPIDGNIEELRVELLLLVGLEPSSQKELLCFYFPFLPFKCHPNRSKSCWKQALKAEKARREATALPPGRQRLPKIVALTGREEEVLPLDED